MFFTLPSARFLEYNLICSVIVFVEYLFRFGAGEGKSIKKAKEEPTREEMHEVVVNILKEVDFNTATLSDILRQLGNHFSVDLLHRKSEVKDIITEAIKNMSDDEDDEDEEASESGDESGKDGRDDEA